MKNKQLPITSMLVGLLIALLALFTLHYFLAEVINQTPQSELLTIATITGSTIGWLTASMISLIAH